MVGNTLAHIHKIKTKKIDIFMQDIQKGAKQRLIQAKIQSPRKQICFTTKQIAEN